MSVAVTVTSCPPTTEVVPLNPIRLGDEMMNAHDLETAPRLAVKVACTAELTGAVVIPKVAVTEPAGISTVDGTIALTLFELRFTVTPPDGAGPVSPTVPVDVEPPTTVPGFATIE